MVNIDSLSLNALIFKYGAQLNQLKYVITISEYLSDDLKFTIYFLYLHFSIQLFIKMIILS